MHLVTKVLEFIKETLFMKYLLLTLSCKSTYLTISEILFSYRYYGLISGAAFTIALYSILYLSTFAVYATHLHFQLSAAPYPHLSIPGISRLFAQPIVLSAAFLAGLSAGVLIIGNKNEFAHLISNYFTYRKEFKTIRNELYYS